MEGIILLYVVLAAWAGGVVLALIGALKALAGGEKWNWALFGLSMVVALVSGVGYYAIAATQPFISTWYAVLAGFTFGATLETGQSQLIGLAIKAKTKTPALPPPTLPTPGA